MYTLSRHKKRGVDGFKDFVKNLELFPASTVREMIILGLLEDPVYLKWALTNRISFNYFLNLEVDFVLKVFNELNRSLLPIVMSLKGIEEESDFVKNKLPIPLQRQYWELQEVTAVTVSQQDGSRIKIMEKIFELEISQELPAFSWNLPEQEVLLGQNHIIKEDGSYILDFEDGTPALRGQVEKKLRAGEWSHFYPNGQVFATGIYVNGEKAGDWIFYYPSGAIKSQGAYKHDQKNGPWTESKLDGKKIEVNYLEGKVI